MPFSPRDPNKSLAAPRHAPDNGTIPCSSEYMRERINVKRWGFVTCSSSSVVVVMIFCFCFLNHENNHAKDTYCTRKGDSRGTACQSVVRGTDEIEIQQPAGGKKKRLFSISLALVVNITCFTLFIFDSFRLILVVVVTQPFKQKE